MTQAELPTGVALEAFVAEVLAEDTGGNPARGDRTAHAVIPADAQLRASLTAREPLVPAGLAVAAAIFRALDGHATITAEVADGTPLESGATLMRVSGNARALLTAERAALNLVQHLSGIATLTRAYADAIKGTGAVLLDTRKTLPGLRTLNKYAARMGGAVNHRMGLHDAVMIKDNHIAVAGSVTAAVAAALAAGERDIQVECDTLAQVDEALNAGATSLLLDNMSLADLRTAVARVDGRVPLEASGGVTLDTIRAIAETGVDRISVGRITQSAPAIDIGMDY
ncbi:carboxylating nicotinate-nucleotide diphosphorylase [Yunchengibacter salinarum]|uniref:carboxylating nicotinate-nucleotide diphosphorylase n=1 Tax=Yunchengibacter salinarum TaxID=3133399 RepID=UPI0035B61D31